MQSRQRTRHPCTEHTRGVLDVLFAIAEEGEKSPAQVALNWLLPRPGVTAPIIGARTMRNWRAIWARLAGPWVTTRWGV